MSYWVLVYVDDINSSFGPQSITDHVEIVDVNPIHHMLLICNHETIGDVEWEEVEKNRFHGKVYYDGELEPNQYYQIFKVG